MKKLEHKIVELLKADDKNNAKLNTIKSMCDEQIIIISLATFLSDYLKLII
jgi:hypothetical protein